mmetsp:Transcript_5846/g.9388  ORF Transcript_5846/g.9388 Transcript_5846/m.9388 type:complete len:90 (+) Transcript_5846:2897-3166(+)
MKLTSPDAGKGIRTIGKIGKAHEKCIVQSNVKVKKDGSSVKEELSMNEDPMFTRLSENLKQDILREEFAVGMFTTEECNLDEEVTPFMK